LKKKKKKERKKEKKPPQFVCKTSIQSVSVGYPPQAEFYNQSAAELPQMATEDLHTAQAHAQGLPSWVLLDLFSCLYNAVQIHRSF